MSYIGAGWSVGLALLALVLLLLIGAALIVGVVLLIRMAARPADTSAGALGILKERYARGEITREEYEALRRDIAA